MTKEQIFDQIKRELEFIYDGEGVALDTNFACDLGMDNLDMVEFVGDLELRFEFNSDEFDSKPETVSDLVDKILEQKRR